MPDRERRRNDERRRNVVRWLLRPLAEPAFLRLYLDEDDGLPFRCFEDAFFGLVADGERPEEARAEAWCQLDAWARGERSAVGWFRAVLRGLRERHAQDAYDLARYWALPELFEEPSAKAAAHDKGAPSAPAYHEIHCHFRGAVPYLELWRGWLENERLRAALRRYECRVGTWHRTWAELVSEASRQKNMCPAPPQGQDKPALYERWLAQNELDKPAAVRYLAVCTALARFLLYQRGEAGLSSFVVAYDRYAKVQKLRGGPERDRTRELVRIVLKRFEDEGAAAVELRPTLERRRGDLQRKLTDLVLGYFDYLAETERPVLMGLVPSLFKQEAVEHGEPEDPAFWERQAAVWEAQVEALLCVIDEVPALRWFVVGLDAAGKERGCPPRALRSAFDLVRRYNRGREHTRPGRAMSAAFLKKLAREGSGPAFDELNRRDEHVEPVRLGITVHAGEDFEDPLTGLRHIWETAVDLDLNEGDRIGHALAAGLDRNLLCELLERRARTPGRGVERLAPDGLRYRVRKPRGTHLLDLAWERRLGEGTDQRDADQRLAEAGARMFGAPPDAARLARALNGHGAVVRVSLPAARFDDPGQLAPEDHEWVVLDEAWADRFARLRRRVLQELIRRRLMVESCPTSNMAVANLTKPPLRVLVGKRDRRTDGDLGGETGDARDGSAGDEPALRVAIATDDPGLLGSFPRAELARFADSPDIQERVVQATAEGSFVRAPPERRVQERAL